MGKIMIFENYLESDICVLSGSEADIYNKIRYENLRLLDISESIEVMRKLSYSGNYSMRNYASNYKSPSEQYIITSDEFMHMEIRQEGVLFRRLTDVHRVGGKWEDLKKNGSYFTYDSNDYIWKVRYACRISPIRQQDESNNRLAHFWINNYYDKQLSYNHLDLGELSRNKPVKVGKPGAKLLNFILQDSSHKKGRTFNCNSYERASIYVRIINPTSLKEMFRNEVRKLNEEKPLKKGMRYKTPRGLVFAPRLSYYTDNYETAIKIDMAYNLTPIAHTIAFAEPIKRV